MRDTLTTILSYLVSDKPAVFRTNRFLSFYFRVRQILKRLGHTSISSTRVSHPWPAGRSSTDDYISGVCEVLKPTSHQVVPARMWAYSSCRHASCVNGRAS